MYVVRVKLPAMIRGNYSLSKEVRKNEVRQKQKIQLRQKHQNQLDRLTTADPIKVYFNLQRLSNQSDLDQHQQKRLRTLKEDWAFILKQKLHHEKVTRFLEAEKEKKAARERQEKKLLGSKSVYFNPEWNPLGKVPDLSNTSFGQGKLPNLQKGKHNHVYEPDPLIAEWNIPMPEGEPPKFYKMVQNTSVMKPKKKSPVPETIQASLKHDLDSDSDDENKRHHA